MKKPKNPPPPTRIVPQDLARWFKLVPQVPGPTYKGEYIHWDKLRHLEPPTEMSHEELWRLIKLHRHSLYKSVPLKDDKGRPFQYAILDQVVREFHRLDKEAAGQIIVAEQVTNPDVRDRYVIHSLMEEAITSSQIEGAAVTRRVAKEMLRTGRKPRDKGERMIANNYAAMQRIRQIQGQPLTIDLIVELQRILTEDAADVQDAAGRLRRPDERVQVISEPDGEVLHDPPPADELVDRLAALCKFANDGLRPIGVDHDKPFLHPVARAIILHFWLAYDHPFADGNGRTARALFYWSMLSSGYWLCEFISISQQIRKAQAQYGRAFLHVESDENDLTYFLLYHLDLIRKALDELNNYLKRKMQQVREAERLLRDTDKINHRQVTLLAHALRHPDSEYTIISHQQSQGVSHQTARDDLFRLKDLGVLEVKRRGKTYHFYPARDLESRMRRL